MFRRLASNPTLAILLAGAAPLLIRAMLLSVIPIPQPRVQDEFSHLLIADTFAQGRVVNPMHPMWIHFESMHEMVRPVYASAYPIAQGAVMGLAKRVTGNPWIGVWLSVGGMCASICWMLQGWVSRRWALLGGLLAAARYGVLSYWMNSYYGGAVAAIGGALVMGAFARLVVRRGRQRAALHAGLFAMGLAILANSRPYEGAIFSLPFVAAMVPAVMRGRVPRVRVLIPAGVILGIAAVGMSYYFARVTGNPLRLPYTFYRDTVTEAPHFVWQAPRPAPTYFHRTTKDFYHAWEMKVYEAARANRSPYGLVDKAKTYFYFFLGPLLALPILVTVPWMWKNRRTRLLLLVGALFAVGLGVEVWHSPQYGAPATGLAVLLPIQALRLLRRGRYGQWIVGVIAVGVVFTPVHRPELSGDARARVLDQLEASPGRQLAIVRYTYTHDYGNEWVYNDAEIDGAKVVWAREMDLLSNSGLLEYFRERRAWLVEPDVSPPRVSPYDPNAPPPLPALFVKLGTAEIEAIREPHEVGRKVLARALEGEADVAQMSCDQWNYYFTAVTGMEAPAVSNACFVRQRGEAVSFDRWLGWLERQR